MFARFRQTDRRLKISLAENRRVDGRVVQEHVACLGSVDVEPSPRERAKFWAKLHQRLAGLSNRVDAAGQAKILAAIHSRVPMVTIEEQQAVKLENAQADERLWTRLAQNHGEQCEGHRQIIARAQAAFAASEAGATDARAEAAKAKNRVERLRRGEDVPGGLGEPVDVEAFLRAEGWTTADPNHARLLSEVAGALGEDATFKKLLEERERAERRTVRRLARELPVQLDDEDRPPNDPDDDDENEEDEDDGEEEAPAVIREPDE